METIGLVLVLAGFDPLTGNHRGESGANSIKSSAYPDFAYANIVRGEVALKEQDWPVAQKYFEVIEGEELDSDCSRLSRLPV